MKYLLTIWLIISSLLVSGQTLYQESFVKITYGKELLKKAYCSEKKKDIYLIKMIVTISNESWKDACISGAVFVSEDNVIVGGCVANKAVESIGDYLIHFNSTFVKCGTSVILHSTTWVMDPLKLPDWSVDEILMSKAIAQNIN